MMMDITDKEFSLLKDLLCRISGIDIPPNKQYLFKTRLSNFLIERGFKDFSDFFNMLSTGDDAGLEKEFIQSMTTHESSFFRDRHPFSLLEKKLIPEIAARKIRDAVFMPVHIRILSAGCSRGQEAYSIAMCIDRWLKALPDGHARPEITILAADISRKVLDRAAEGRYTELEVGTHIPPELKKEYFAKSGELWEIRDGIREMVSFSELNLSEAFESIGRFDIIFCRNVIIYFPLDLKTRIIKGFYNALNKGGALILGSSENLYKSHDDFNLCTAEEAMYFVPRK